MDAYYMNARLIDNHRLFSAEVEVWAARQYSQMNSECARRDLEAAVQEARNCPLGEEEGCQWMYYTGSDLCAALGNCTLAYAVEHLDEFIAHITQEMDDEDAADNGNE